MVKEYVKIDKIYQKIKQAQNNQQILYITAPVGIGKTEAVKYFYRKKPVLWLSGENGYLSQMPQYSQIKQETVVIDDLSFINDNESKKYIIQLIGKKKKHIVMMGRAKLPEWLKKSCLENQFFMTDYSNLLMNNMETEKLLSNYKVNPDKDTIHMIREDTMGHALFIVMIAYRMQDNRTYTKSIREAARIDTYQYYHKNLYERWPTELGELLTELANFEVFTVELAEMISGNCNAFALLNMAMSLGNFLIVHEDGSYEMWKRLREYLLYRQSLDKDMERENEIFSRAALYYEMHEQIDQALFYFKKANKEGEIIRLLIKNAKCHVGTGHYFENRKYYLELSDDEIKKSSILMAGVSMLYSLMMQPDKSEEWYQQLKKYEKKPTITKEEKKEAQKRILYLDISLPHRGIVKMTDILKKSALMLTDREFRIPDFSVTSNLPSIMNGGKDFCEWSKSDKELARVMKKPVEMVLGKWSAGLVHISLAESQFEKGVEDLYEVMTLLNSGYTKADMGGKIEMCFTATAILCRIHVCRNQMQVARNQLLSFKEKAKAEEASRLIPNIETMENWFNLLEGKKEKVEEWLNHKAPDENFTFNILYRYQYMMKIRTYLALGRYEEAAGLSQRLYVYFKGYRRTYLDMENEILKAIIQYRMKAGNWKETLKEVLFRTESYHFIDIVAKEGIAVRELLGESEDQCLHKEYGDRLLQAVNSMALFYPNYLKEQEPQTEELTETEDKILHLYKEGIAAKEICDLCCFSYNTLKFHNKNIYKKLGVNNRTEAVRAAKEMDL